ncbi:MAG: DNA repair protein RecN [Bacteroidales bacterium]|nr:DNA repair protein RecN [Bacteroidales bacterium]
MLKELKTNNYLLINDLTLDFSDGFTLITGETGAGKSVLVGAIMLLLGEKTDAKVFYAPEKKCIIEGVFDIEKLGLQSFFEEQELDYQPETIIRREIIPDSARSRAFINDTPVTNAQLKLLGTQLIDIHSQHETLNLNNPLTQLQMIDRYGKLEQDTASLKVLYTAIKKQKNALSEQMERLQETLREQDFRQHALQELTEVHIKQGETEELEQKFQLMNNADAVKIWLEKIHYLCMDQEPSIVEMLKVTTAEGNKISINNDALTQIIERLHATSIELTDIANEARHINDRLSNDTEQLQQIEARLDCINRLMFKYHVQNEQQLFQLIDAYQTQVDNVAELETSVAELQQQIADNEALWQQKALELQGKRKTLFPEIEQTMTALLKMLGMPDAQFTIQHEILPAPSEFGLDKICFLFTANKGQKPSDLRAVASGGELSRIMLSMKNLMGNTQLFPTMIFDEIDTGISGAVAIKAGEMLKSMAKNKQIIVITHLPTIAAFANQHLYVSKETADRTTLISVRYLSKEERVKELAQMLSGDQAMPEAIETAAKLMESAAKK